MWHRVDLLPLTSGRLRQARKQSSMPHILRNPVAIRIAAAPTGGRAAAHLRNRPRPVLSGSKQPCAKCSRLCTHAKPDSATLSQTLHRSNLGNHNDKALGKAPANGSDTCLASKRCLYRLSERLNKRAGIKTFQRVPPRIPSTRPGLDSGGHSSELAWTPALLPLARCQLWYQYAAQKHPCHLPAPYGTMTSKSDDLRAQMASSATRRTQPLRATTENIQPPRSTTTRCRNREHTKDD